jgi:LacI family transcriptional regulator
VITSAGDEIDEPAPLRQSTAGRVATRADVARYAGVSTAVVSYVVNRGPRNVAPETAARVLAAVETLNYHPNPNARALSKGSSEMVGLVLPDIGNPFFAELAREIEVAAASRGHLLVMATTGTQATTERRVVADLARRHLDGLLLSTVLAPSELHRLYPPSQRTVLVNISSPFPGYAGIGPDAEGGAYALVEHLVDAHGHRSVALIMGASSEKIPEPREKGWARVFEFRGLPPGPVVRSSFDREGGYTAAQQMLRWREPPTAMFASSDQQATGALRAIREASLRCPEDVALVSFDGTQETAFTWPPLTVARQPVRAMAQAAIAAVLEPTGDASYQQFDIELVIRESCGCAVANR